MLLALALGARVLLAGTLDLSPDEAYYWSWGRSPSWTGWDHPPLVGWLMAYAPAGDPLRARAATLLCGAVAALASVWAVVWACTAHAQDRDSNAHNAHHARDAATWGALLALTPGALAAGVLATPDAPLLAGWALACVASVWAWTRASKPERPARLGAEPSQVAAACGVAAGVALALMAKLPGWGLVVGLVWAAGVARPGAARRAVVAGVCAGLALSAPVWLSAAGQGGADVAFQWARLSGRAALRPLGPLEVLGAGLGLMTPVLGAGAVAFVVAGMQQARRRSWSAALRGLWALSVAPMAACLALAVVVPVEANWAAPAWLTASMGAVVWAWGASGRWARWGLRGWAWTGPALALVVVGWGVWGQAAGVAPTRDPVARVRGWEAWGAQLERAVDGVRGEGAAQAPVWWVTSRYQEAAALAFARSRAATTLRAATPWLVARGADPVALGAINRARRGSAFERLVPLGREAEGEASACRAAVLVLDVGEGARLAETWREERGRLERVGRVDAHPSRGDAVEVWWARGAGCE